MKKNILVLFVLIFQTVQAQNTTEIIKKDFESIVKYTQTKQIDKIIDLTYPRLFDLYGKKGLTALATGLTEGMGITTIYEEIPLNLKLSKISKLKNASICMGEYNQSMILEFNDETFCSMFSETKNTDLTIEKIDAKKIRMKGKSYLLAINDSSTNNTWKYLNYTTIKPDSPALLFSKEIAAEAILLQQSFNKK